MKKRLRKKKRIGEFKELCFEVRAELRAGIDEAALEAFLGRFAGYVEDRALCFGGGVGTSLTGVVARDGRGSVTEEERAAVEAWLKADADVASQELGPLRDAWYGWKRDAAS